VLALGCKIEMILVGINRNAIMPCNRFVSRFSREGR